MPSDILRLLLLLPVCWISWRLIKRRVFPTTLQNIPGPPGQSWIKGSISHITNRKAWSVHREISEKYGSVVRTKGAFGSDKLYVFDPKAMHHIFVKDQHIYTETARFIEGNKVVFGIGILSTEGEEHRRHRKMFSPVFSAAHLRGAVPVFLEVTRKVHAVFTDKAMKGTQEVDIANWMARLALELIGQSGLGYTFDELTETAVTHRFAAASKQLMQHLRILIHNSPLQTHADEFFTTEVMPKLMKIGTLALRKFIVDLLPFQDVRLLRDIINVLYTTSIEIFESKKKVIEHGDDTFSAEVGQGKDIISILMKANTMAEEGERLSDEEVIAGITMLTFAAMDTTSTALSRVFYMLALRKDAQSKLREEIRQARKDRNGGEFTYDELVSLPYLDAICRETLRLYPPVSLVNRTASEDVVMPLSKPITGINGEEIHEIPLPKGTDILVSLLSANRNAELWGPDANEWKPERWLEPLPKALVDARVPGIYSHMMTFIGGGRSCIGFKFSQLEMKAVLSTMIETLEFSFGDKENIWQMTGIATPHLDWDSKNPTMPMMISIAK